MLQDTEHSNHGVKRSSSYWFHDGSIVLQVETTQYRVHQSLLAKDFRIFADAFSFAKSDEAEDVEGCPVVKVEGDQVEDWENVLMTVYKPFSTYPSTNDYPIPAVLSTLRLATKYESDHLRDMAATCLRNHIPRSLQSWRQMYYQGARPLEDYIFDIIEIGLELGLYSILPVAYLICIRFIGLDEILDGLKRKDGSISSLSPSTTKTLLLGRQSLLVSAMEFIVNKPMTWNIPEGCKGQVNHGDFDYIACDLDARGDLYRSCIDDIAENPADAFHCGISFSLCEVCTALIEDKLEEGRRELWTKLPSFFGLPKWNEAKDFFLS